MNIMRSAALFAILLVPLCVSCEDADSDDGGSSTDMQTSADDQSLDDSRDITFPDTHDIPPLDPLEPPITEGEWWRPADDITWQWQLQGPVNVSYDVDVYDVDLFDTSAGEIAALQSDGKRVLCYFSAGSWEDWREDAGHFPVEALGAPLDGWEGERWLDIRSLQVLSIMLDRLDLAAARGCDGVEPDNVDGWDNQPGFDLTFEDQLAYNRRLANEAHLRGLAVALKNAVEYADNYVEYYDLTVNEQCLEYDECSALNPFVAAGKPILNAEYGADSQAEADAALTELCPRAAAAHIHTLVLPLELDDSFRAACD